MAARSRSATKAELPLLPSQSFTGWAPQGTEEEMGHSGVASVHPVAREDSRGHAALGVWKTVCCPHGGSGGPSTGMALAQSSRLTLLRPRSTTGSPKNNSRECLGPRECHQQSSATATCHRAHPSHSLVTEQLSDGSLPLLPHPTNQSHPVSACSSRLDVVIVPSITRKSKIPECP